MASEDQQPIIVKRVFAAHGHHGGSWKVAFADFATAMMAFFMLMWLMGSTSAEQKGAISEYFKNPSAVQGTSPVPSPSSIQGPGGASTSMIQLGGSTELYAQNSAAKNSDSDANSARVSDQEAEQQAAAAETERLENLKERIQKAIDERDSLKAFKDQILLDITPEGLRIQVIDKENRSMFDSGSAELKPYTLDILTEIAAIVSTVPNRLSISGHTDVRPYTRLNYSNWELSADRANAARRALISGGLAPEKIGRVVGLASSALLDKVVQDNPINRRISIIVMNARTEAAIQQEGASIVSVQSNEKGEFPAISAGTAAQVSSSVP
jgi:chemotaxis protein MotB